MTKIIKHVVFVGSLMFLAACGSDSDSPTPDTPTPTPETPVIRLVGIDKDGASWKTFSYDDDGLTSYKTFYSETGYYEFKYYYNANGRIDSVQKVNGVTLNATIVYYYVSDTKIERLEYYSSNNTLYNTATYTYTGDLLTNIDNSDKSVQGLHFRNFEYSTEHNVSKVSFDFGNSWNYVYATDKPIETPLAFDISDPLNTIKHLISSFTYVQYSSYTATYAFDADGLLITETRNYPGRPANDPSYPQEEVYTYEYQ